MFGFFSSNRFSASRQLKLMQFARPEIPLWYEAPDIRTRIKELQRDSTTTECNMFFKNMSANKGDAEINNCIEFIHMPFRPDVMENDSLDHSPDVNQHGIK
jgi:hypothetical protein